LVEASHNCYSCSVPHIYLFLQGMIVTD